MDFDMQKAMGKSEAAGEDMAFYEIYPDDPGQSEGQLEALKKECLEMVLSYTQDYIWQRECFGLWPSHSYPRPWAAKAAAGDQPACLWGQTCYGDNVEDEWFITWLLLQVTRHLKLSARIWDSDGEFLLIEAAYALPPWLKPEMAAERVWLREGALHIIPQASQQHPSIPRQPTTRQALQILQSLETIAPSQMQAAISVRLADYPQAAKKNTHHAAATLPASLAAVLQQEPQLVSSAVEAFYYRDPQDVKAARKLTHFPADKEMVETVVSFSRCLYAQMVTQGYDAPRRYPLPLPSEEAFAAAQLGMKLVAGFEMLLAQASMDLAPGPGEVKDVEGVAEWQAYLQSLADQGFFQGQLTGSHLHTHLMAKAAAHFRATEAYATHRAAAQKPAERILELAQQPFDPSQVTAVGESDGWMAEAAEEIEAELQRRKEEVPQDGGQPEDLAKRFNEFLGGEAGIEGIDEEAGLFDEDPLEGLNSEEGDVELSEQEIWKEMKRMLHFKERSKLAEGTSDEGSSFYGDDYLTDDDSEGESRHDLQEAAFMESRRTLQEEEKAARARCPPKISGGASKAARQRAASEDDDDEEWDVATATDSDDDGTGSSSEEDVEPGYFDKAYDEVMCTELSSHQAMRVSDPFSASAQPPNDGDHLEEVDVDLNLVQNLMASYNAQEGLPGPVGNLAGMLGLHFPRQNETRDEYMRDAQ